MSFIQITQKNVFVGIVVVALVIFFVLFLNSTTQSNESFEQGLLSNLGNVFNLALFQASTPIITTQEEFDDLVATGSQVLVSSSYGYSTTIETDLLDWADELDARYNKPPLGTTPNPQPIKDALAFCLERSLYAGVAAVASQGGRFDFEGYQQQSGYVDGVRVNNGYTLGVNTLPSVGQMENQIEAFIKKAVPICFDNYRLFIDGIVSFNHVLSNVDVVSGSVSAVALIQIKVNRFDDDTENFDTVGILTSVSSPTHLLALYNLAHQMVNKEIAEPDTIDLEFIDSISELAGVETAITHITPDEIIYDIIDPEEKLVFRFRNEFVSTDNCDLAATEEASDALCAVRYGLGHRCMGDTCVFERSDISECSGGIDSPDCILLYGEAGTDGAKPNCQGNTICVT
jgi:hypothetical protein